MHATEKYKQNMKNAIRKHSYKQIKH